MILLDRASLPYLPYPYLSIPTDNGRKLSMNTPGPIVYSQLAYLTQAITLNDRHFNGVYQDEYYRQPEQFQHVQQQLQQPTYAMKHEKHITVTEHPQIVRTDLPEKSAETFQSEPNLLPSGQPEITKDATRESYQKLVHKQHRQASPPRS